jgi:hypothetical protein
MQQLRPHGSLRPLRLPAIAAIAGLVLSACSPVVDVTPAKDAANAACAPMMLALPDSLGDAKLRKTNSQATAAWGDPSLVVLRCGVNVPGPTTDRCVSVNGVDWVIKEGNPVWTLTTFGREPATEILMDPNKISSATVLAELAAPAAKIKATRKCVGQQDLQNLPTGK